jgi:hypothetical protein
VDTSLSPSHSVTQRLSDMSLICLQMGADPRSEPQVGACFDSAVMLNRIRCTVGAVGLPTSQYSSHFLTAPASFHRAAWRGYKENPGLQTTVPLTQLLCRSCSDTADTKLRIDAWHQPPIDTNLAMQLSKSHLQHTGPTSALQNCPPPLSGKTNQLHPARHTLSHAVHHAW